ncbi:unnamed protein product, partial [Brenthis ino]
MIYRYAPVEGSLLDTHFKPVQVEKKIQKVVALVSHLSTNFWERYVMHKELCSVKNNLEILKVTVNNIGNAYDNLHNELIDLAENKRPKHPSPRHDTKFSYKDQNKNTAKTLHDELRNEINDRHIYSALKEEMSRDNKNETRRNGEARNKTTLARYPTKTTAVGCELYTTNHEFPKYCESRYSCKLKETHKCRQN